MSGLSDLPTSPWLRAGWIVLALVLVGFHIGLIFSGLIPNLVSRPLHLALILPFVFLFGVTGRMALAGDDHVRDDRLQFRIAAPAL